MALYWSWAFGNETTFDLKNNMGFGLDNTGASYTQITTNSNSVYSYPGSPTRYSLDLRRGNRLVFPTGIWLDAGWIAMPIRTFQGFDSDRNSPVMQAYGNNQQVYIFCSDESTEQLSLSFQGGGTSDHVIGTYPDGDWRYFAMRYNTSISQPTAEVWVDGILVLSATSSWSGTANTSGYYRAGGFGDGLGFTTPNAPLAQITIYDTGSLSSGYPYEPRFVTRVNPTADESGVGVFTPSVGSSDFAVLSSSFGTSSFTSNTGSNVGDRVVCKASGTLGFYSQLGTTPTDIRGLTLHGWASGSGQNGFVGISNNNSTYDTGSHITPDINDSTYGYVTAADQPSDAAAWNTGSLLYVKYEVS